MGERPDRFSHEPYRRKLYIMRNRLRHNLKLTTARIEHPEIRQPGQIIRCRYRNEQEFLSDLKLIQASLASHGDQNIAPMVNYWT